MRVPLCHVELNVPVPIEPPPPKEGTWLLQAITPFRERRIIVFYGSQKREELGPLVTGLAPRADDTFLLEIGAILGDNLPTVHGSPEYALSLPATDAHEARELFFSNQLARVRFSHRSDPYQILCPMYRLNDAISEARRVPSDAYVEYLKTAVTARYALSGADPEEALSSHLYAALTDFISCINHVVAAHLRVAREEWGILTPVYDHGSFDQIYLMIAGDDPGMIVHERLAISTLRAPLVGPMYSREAEAQFHAIVNDPDPQDPLLLLRQARSYIEGGILHLALLQLAIAAEVETSRLARRYDDRHALTNSSQSPSWSKASFSKMLSQGLDAIAPASKKLDPQLLARIDRLRVLRNRLMHRGAFETSLNELRQLHVAAKQYVAWLRELDATTLP